MLNMMGDLFLLQQMMVDLMGDVFFSSHASWT
jgi:hypothetical protein